MIDDYRAGRNIILLNDLVEVSIGYYVTPAHGISAESVNFLATFGKGIVSIALTETLCNELGLIGTGAGLMRPSRKQSALMPLIEAAVGVTTGISARDRAQTIRVAADSQFSSRDIVIPGRIRPVKAKDGGILNKVGVEEAAIDLANIARSETAAVICEILDDDGNVATSDYLARMAEDKEMNTVTRGDFVEFRVSNFLEL